MENLPDEPTNIFFYNHLASIEENGLANGHQFSIDSHFISAKILFPKYGDGGQRIARYSRNTEFWRYNYYENLAPLNHRFVSVTKYLLLRAKKKWQMLL